ncbi:MAG: restriction endonuclease subunit S [Flavobacteriales bacterium]|nr:restriction endonuclease subunit S [Flavobacteriales bacterium]
MTGNKTLSEVCEFQEGYVNPSQKERSYFGGDIKWLRASDLNDGFVYDTEAKLSEKGFLSAGKSAKLFKKGTLAISKSGTIGRLGILQDEMCGNRAVINIDVNEDEANLKYVFYTLKYKVNELIGKAGGSIQKNLYISSLETLALNHNSKSDQQKIAKVLSDLDAKIELNNKINAELEAMAKLIYDYWFVQFDFPDANGKPYKSSGGAMVYNAELKREIPKGWEVKKLEEIVKHNYDSLDRNKRNAQIEYLDTSSLTNNVVNGTQFLDSRISKIPSRAQRKVNSNDILYSTVRPNLCHYGIIKHPKREMVASTGFVQLTSKNNEITSDLIYTFLTSSWVTERLHQIAVLSVSAYPSISAKDVLELKIALPKDKKVLKTINTTLHNVYAKVSLNQKQNQHLSSLRDWLLPMLMNGQVRVG